MDYPFWGAQQPQYQYGIPTPEENVDILLQRAREYQQLYTPQMTLDLYQRAIDICQKNGLYRKQAEVHCALFEVLRTHNLSLAMKEADNAISMCPEYDQGYYCRAQAMEYLAKHHTLLHNPVLARSCYSKSIEDLMLCYRLSRARNSGKGLPMRVCQAITIGVNQGLTQSLNLITTLNKEECTEVIKFLAASPSDETLQWSSKHVSYLVKQSRLQGSGVAVTLACNLSGFKWKNILQKHDLNLHTTQAIISLGGVFALKDLDTIVLKTKDAKVDIFQLAITTCSMPVDEEKLKYLFEQALKLKKLKFVEELLKHSLSLANEHSDVLIKQSLKLKRFDVIADVIRSGASIDPVLIVQEITKSDFTSIDSSIMAYIKSTTEGRIRLFFKAVEHSEFSLAQDCLTGGNEALNLSAISLSAILKFPISKSSHERKKHVLFIQWLLDTGVEANKRDEDEDACPLDIVLELSKEYDNTKIEFLTLLLEHGAAIDCCTYQKKRQTTLLHVAIKLAIESDCSEEAIKLLEAVCKYYPYHNHHDGRIQDKKGDTPYHLVMERKNSPNTVRLCEILKQYPINPNVANSHGKKPIKSKSHHDKRHIILQEAAAEFQARSSSKKNGKKKKKSKAAQKLETQNLADENLGSSTRSASESKDQPDKQPQASAKPPAELDIDEVADDVKSLLSDLANKPSSYFEPPVNYKRQGSQPVAQTSSVDEDPVGEDAVSVIQKQKPPSKKIESSARKPVDTTAIASNFDGCCWEVECTDKVKKFFANTKIPKPEKEAVVKTIRKLADGIPLNNSNLSKEIRSRSKLFESHYSKGSRILFEVAIQFSPRMTTGTSYMYSEVIRLWDIVRHHDNLNRSIDHAVECIEKSQQRGETAAVRTPLRTQNGHCSTRQCTQGQEKVRLPQCYIGGDDSEAVRPPKALSYLPAGSTRDDEYNVITFYSFDSSFIQSMLDGENARRDFPFKEWPKEHDIINMPHGKVSILLLGRSGTGKTTCCLYRLWNHFQNYWAQAITSGPLITRRPLAILENKEAIESDDSESPDEGESDSSPSAPEELNMEELPDTDLESPRAQVAPEHFHQVFITKNYVLCAQMKKRFYDLAAGRETAKDHMEFEDSNTPISLSAVDDLAYPLFLTARQFFVLLDNSLEDGKNFFKRDGDGKLVEKILSSDYDHENPDTLLDLEESDSEDEMAQDSDFDEEGIEQQPATEKKKLQQRREVTASYFAEKIWPKISKSVTLRDTKIDPLLVWMEIKSFIKGSMLAVEKEEGHLSKEEYERLGRKMAPNYEDRRQDIYRIFELYKDYIQNHSCDDNIFDECDLNFNLYSRLNALKDLPWSIHSLYIDEVQDFTQAELSIFIRICRDPNDLFLTGDTAQSIMRGIAFRFGDLKSIFYRASKQVSRSVKSVPVKVPKVDELTINFRSHTGILRLAASIIDLMKHFFPNSFDCLPGDEGMFPGPIPVVLDACHVSDLALVLRSNKRESSTIEFGAHQVIIVQSEEAKKNIPDVLSTGIVLTVFESKGLEFDDVLLYNFFKDSKIEKDWRVVTSFIEDYPDKIVNTEKGPFGNKPRKLKFDKSHHKSLNAELKYLYTAITRAKCNLWIYDSDEEKRLPVFDYWSKCGLVKVVRISDIQNEAQNTLFSATSSKEEWKAQGDYFKKKRLWEPAMKCYRRAECPHLESEARAYSLAQQAHTPGLRRIEVEEIYLKSAHAFLKCDQALHDYSCLENAAKCLKNAKRYKESSQLYIHLGQTEKALKGYRRTKDVEGLALLKNKTGDYNGVIRLLLKHNRVSLALKYASKYEAEKIPIDECFRVSIIASEFFSEKLANPNKLSSSESVAEFERVMEYVSPSEKVSYYKDAGMYEQACEVLSQEGKYTEVYRIYKAQAWHQEGVQLARSNRHREEEETFMLLKASMELSSESGELSDTTITMLSKKWGSKTEREVRVGLVYGMGIQNYRMIMTACKFFKTRHNPIAFIAAFNAALAPAKYNQQEEKWENIHLERNESLLDLTLAACKEISNIINTLKNPDESSSNLSRLIGQIENFYGLEKKHRVVNESLCEFYCIPSSSFPWTDSLLSERLREKANRDADGMLEVEAKEVHRGVRKQLEHFLKKMIVSDKLDMVRRFKEAFRSHRMYQLIVESKGYLPESETRFTKVLNFPQFWKMLNMAFDITRYGDPEISVHTCVQLVLNTMSPQAICYLPPSTVTIQSDQLAKTLHEMVADVLRKDDSVFNFDEWLYAWRINCINTKEPSRMEDILKRKSYIENQKPQHHIQPVYVRTRDRNSQYQHVILEWLKSCGAFKASRIFKSCTITVCNVLSHIAAERSMWTTLSISNLLNITTIHGTAILIMYATCLAHMSNVPVTMSVYMPLSYKTVVDHFHNINSLGRSDFDFSLTCYREIITRRRDDIFNKLLAMLQVILKVMLGMHNQACNPLRYALSSERCLKNHEAQHCLVFVMTLFSNLALLSNLPDGELYAYRLRIFESLKFCTEPKLKEACERFVTSRTLIGCFGVIRDLLDASKDSLLALNVQLHVHGGVSFSPASLNSIYPRQLFPIPVHLLSHRPAPVSMRAPEPEPQAIPPSIEVPKELATHPSAPVLDSPTVPELKTLVSVEADDDDDEDQSGSQMPIERDPMVDETLLCRVCVRQLRMDSQDAEETSKDGDTEPYSQHCRSESHLKNIEIYRLFQEEVEDFYEPRKRALLELEPKCVELNSVLHKSYIGSCISTLQREIKEGDSTIKRVRGSAQWREGKTLLRDILDKLQSLEMKTKQVIEKAEEEEVKLKKTKEKQRKKAEEEEEEEEREDAYLEDDDEVILNAPAKSGHKSKQHKRKVKQQKKRAKLK